MRTGAYFASQLASTPTRGLRVLDMGTGSGICALAAARHADHVVAVDINPAAVQCCALNAERNRLQDKVTVLQSDLFAALPGQRFDLVMFNPPFLLGAPTDDYDHAWRSVDVASRFAHQLRDHLTDGGFALLLLSTFGDQEIFLGPLRSEGLSCTAYRTKRYFNETVTIYRVAGAP
jgi:release factor glutamine methyltransferase